MEKFLLLNMDAFSDGQVASKLWICQELENQFSEISNLWIYGSWYGTLPFFLLLREKIQIGEIHLFEIDQEALEISKRLLNHWDCFPSKKIFWHLRDCQNFSTDLAIPSVIINTSTEHFVDDGWAREIPQRVFLAVQSTNMIHEEHVNPCQSLPELATRLNISPTYEGQIHFEYGEFKFDRFMVMGYRKGV